MKADVSRAAVVAVARDWIGTPYRHQASAKGIGCDCLGLVRGVWRELCGQEPETPPPYSPDWAEVTGEETLYAAARRHLIEIAPEHARAGDIFLFRVMRNGPAKHVALLTAPARILHAYSGYAVREEPLGSWRRRIAYAFQFPGIED